ncbi:EH domain-containing protein 1 [Symbiodinium microadriaticum]|uniref:EH domain-containing protein 1 n=1 Tax=Symbiodinium microadriaticum TaxID=2951 RepID=A0A1Q9C2D6_SYMMI|nr:EH domain-containing protein 1 [Symbiodinium microadriaticum]
MLEWLDSSDTSGVKVSQVYDSVTTGLQAFYRSKLLPIEKDHLFHQFYSPELTDADFASAPMVLLMGQYSTGKTTFIRHLLQRDYPGMRIGLSHFGNAFLSRLEASRLSSPVLEGLTLIDTPGVLSGEKQRIKRGYEFEAVVKWFAERVVCTSEAEKAEEQEQEQEQAQGEKDEAEEEEDMILLLFDVSKLDISDEFRRVIQATRGNDHKICILLNKALCHSFGVAKGGISLLNEKGTFWDQPLKNEKLRELFEQEDRRKVNVRASVVKEVSTSDLIKRARLAKVHALLLDYFYKRMPTFFGHAKEQVLLQALQAVRWKHSLDDAAPVMCRIMLQSLYLDPSDVLGCTSLPLQQILTPMDFSTFKPVDPEKLQAVEALLAVDLPKLLQLIPEEQVRYGIEEAAVAQIVGMASPFAVMKVEGNTEQSVYKGQWQRPPTVEQFQADFDGLHPVDGKINAQQAKQKMVEAPRVHIRRDQPAGAIGGSSDDVSSSRRSRAWSLAPCEDDAAKAYRLSIISAEDFCRQYDSTLLKVIGGPTPAAPPQPIQSRIERKLAGLPAFAPSPAKVGDTGGAPQSPVSSSGGDPSGPLQSSAGQFRLKPFVRWRPSLRRGGYRSIQNNFDSSVTYTRLKARFPVDRLALAKVFSKEPPALSERGRLLDHGFPTAAAGGESEIGLRHIGRLEAAGLWFRDKYSPTAPGRRGSAGERPAKEHIIQQGTGVDPSRRGGAAVHSGEIVAGTPGGADVTPVAACCQPLSTIQPKMVPYIDDGAPAALIYADAFYQPGEVRRKAGHIAAEVQVNPEAASQVFYDCGTALAPVESIRGAVQPSSGEGDGPGAMLMADMRSVNSGDTDEKMSADLPITLPQEIRQLLHAGKDFEMDEDPEDGRMWLICGRDAASHSATRLCIGKGTWLRHYEAPQIPPYRAKAVTMFVNGWQSDSVEKLMGALSADPLRAFRAPKICELEEIGW